MFEVLRNLQGNIFTSWRTGQAYDLTGSGIQTSTYTLVPAVLLEGLEYDGGDTGPVAAIVSVTGQAGKITIEYTGELSISGGVGTITLEAS